MGSPTLAAERLRELFPDMSKIPVFELELDPEQQTALGNAARLALGYAIQRTSSLQVADAIWRRDLSVRVGFVPPDLLTTGYEGENAGSIHEHLGILDRRPYLDGLSQATLRVSVRAGSLSIDASRQGGVTHGVQFQQSGSLWRPQTAFTTDERGRYSGRVASPRDQRPERRAASMEHLGRATTAIGEVATWIVDIQTGPEDQRLVPQIEFVGDAGHLSTAPAYRQSGD